MRRLIIIKVLSGLAILNNFLNIKKYITSIKGAKAMNGKNIKTHWELLSSLINPYCRFMQSSREIMLIARNILLLINLPVSLFSIGYKNF